jgi:hypothetical protein
MTVVHPISRAWITTGGTGAQNYDEFADDAEITEIIAANPHSALAIEMPHRAPESLGKSFLDCLGDAAQRLARDKAEGSYTPAEQVVVLYRITAAGEPTAYGLWALVDTDQSTAIAGRYVVVLKPGSLPKTPSGKLRRSAATSVASLFYLVPAVTSLMAYALFGEKLDAVAIAGMIACAAAVLVVNRRSV